MHHPRYSANGLVVAGVTRDSIASNRTWSVRMRLPYPLLSDPDGLAGGALGVVRRIPIGVWKLELFRRSTFLVDLRGAVVAVWRDVKVRGHAAEVLDVAKTLERPVS